MRIFEKLQELWERFKSALTPKNILQIILIALVCLLSGAGIIWLFYTLLDFIMVHMDALILGLCIIGALAWYSHRKRQDRKVAEVQEIQTQQEQLALREKARLEKEYLFCRDCLFQVQREIRNKVQLPVIGRPSELDAPEHYVEGKGFYFFQYLVAKGDCQLPPDVLAECFQIRFDQKLKGMEFNGLTQRFYMHTSGRSYSTIYIHNVRDNGSYYQFDIVFAGKPFCDWLESIQSVRCQDDIITSNTDDFDF